MLSFSVQLAKGWYNGESNGHLLLIAGQRTKVDGKTIDWEGINGTMGHELGHAMKMVAMSNLKIPGIADVRKEHTRWYDTTRGHQGDHCAKGFRRRLMTILWKRCRTMKAHASCSELAYREDPINSANSVHPYCMGPTFPPSRNEFHITLRRPLPRHSARIARMPGR